jgi:flagellar basal-body rod protein FlgB
MPEVQLLSLATQKIDWLSMRQLILAQNVANVNTPKYRAMDVVPFESFLHSPQLAMTVSNERHIDASQGMTERVRTQQDRTGDANFSGNNVSLENEFLKLGETNGQFALSTGLIKSFNRMIMASLKA